MDGLKKYKRLYSGELLVFSILFLILGILFLTGVIAVADWKRWAFAILTMLGGAWISFDFAWCLVSKKRRAKQAMIDKVLAVLMAFPVLVFDILAFSMGWVTSDEGVLYFRYVLGVALTYYGAVYLFEAIYHYYRPVPALLEAYEEEKAEEARKAAEAPAPAEEAPGQATEAAEGKESEQTPPSSTEE